MYEYLLSLIYRLFIFRVILIDKKKMADYNKLEIFTVIEMPTNIGLIKFNFKRDRRKRRRNIDKIFLLRSYIVEIAISPDIDPIHKDIEDLIVVVIKIALCGGNPKVLSRVLLNIYMDKVISHLKKDN